MQSMPVQALALRALHLVGGDPAHGRLATDERLGARWYAAANESVALARAAARLLNPWLADHLEDATGPGPSRVLDLGCGVGFLSNHLAGRGHRVTGFDQSAASLRVAEAHDATGTVEYVRGEALALPWPDGTFEAVCAMGFLEQVGDPARVIAEAARVLAPGGRFYFQTVDRTWLTKLLAVKGAKWFVRDAPAAPPVLRQFVRPAECDAMCRAAGLDTLEVYGARPRVGRALARLLATGSVPDDLEFLFTRSPSLGYVGVAGKRGLAA